MVGAVVGWYFAGGSSLQVSEVVRGLASTVCYAFYAWSTDKAESRNYVVVFFLAGPRLVRSFCVGGNEGHSHLAGETSVSAFACLT